jgi:hypothetical protein
LKHLVWFEGSDRESSSSGGQNIWQVKSVARWTHKLAMRSLFLAGTATLLAPLGLAPSASAQVTVGIGIQPVCSYGYYNYAPYGCAPSGFYGPGYFYNGVFLGVGPWANWGYGHGWGEHRFNGAGGGRYVAGRGNGHGYARGLAGVRGHAVAAHGNAAHGESHAAPHAALAHGGGEHGGGEHH